MPKAALNRTPLPCQRGLPGPIGPTCAETALRHRRDWLARFAWAGSLGLARGGALAAWLAGGHAAKAAGAPQTARHALQGSVLAARALPEGMPLAMNASPSLNPHGYWVSEKLDGVRARWDGQSLRTRSGRLIQAPASWLAPLLAMGPDLALDGELWMGRGRFEAVSAAVRRQRPDPAEWQIMRYGVFELPWGAPRFDQRLQQLRQLLPPDPKAWVAAIHQTEINSQEALARWLEAVIQQGGEGLILRAADAPYASGRSPQTWKLKPLDDAEATVIGHEPGRGRLAGLVGALRVRTDEGRVFKIGSGLSDARRKNPPAVGERITYRYRGFTGDGLPRFATYWRERPSEQ